MARKIHHLKGTNGEFHLTLKGLRDMKPKDFRALKMSKFIVRDHKNLAVLVPMQYYRHAQAVTKETPNAKLRRIWQEVDEEMKPGEKPAA